MAILTIKTFSGHVFFDGEHRPYRVDLVGDLAGRLQFKAHLHQQKCRLRS